MAGPIYRSLQRGLRLFGSSTLCSRLLAKHATEQLPAGILRDGINELNATFEPLVLNLHVGHILGHRNGQRPSCDSLQCLTLDSSALRASASALLDAARTTAGGCNTMYASGNSPLKSSGTGTIHTSATSGWLKRCPSSSAGATWKPRTLINSWRWKQPVSAILSNEGGYTSP
jgi:hypothetical protein